ncbi:hypothetical protein QJS10_CPB18g01081 [Acorus calamus]|uniref:Photosynthetic NDH subcomplex B 3 n=1 Tax=Acorus calamus TaxID=4465 RepID=A0AAV9CRG0_ACOCL|nr:hypothetical protein QJS10_CPB18g01081 [Acorus calamus]
MGVLQFNTSLSLTFYTNTRPTRSLPNRLNLTKTRVLRSAEPVQETGVSEEAVVPEEPPSIDFAFVSSKLLPDGTPDVHIRSASGGKKLRDIMLDSHIDLYGPYARPLLNCGGGGTCGTCLVERPKTWRLACQTMVGREDSRGQVVVQTLPDWKVHEWEK